MQLTPQLTEHVCPSCNHTGSNESVEILGEENEFVGYEWICPKCDKDSLFDTP